MLLQALELAMSGNSVLVVDRDAERGGAWQTRTVAGDGGVALQVENACHVIEVFPHVYDLLEKASGVPFVELEAQPVRIHPNGMVLPYFGRTMMLLSLARLALGFATNWSQIYLFGRGDRDRLENFRAKLGSLLRYQAPEFLRNSPMRGPQNGFVDFMARLVNRAIAVGVRFERFEVAELARMGNVWEARDEVGDPRIARVVHMTTSANLRPVGNGLFQAVHSERVQRVAVVVSIPQTDMSVRQTYAAFWGDSLVSRISRLDSPEGNGNAEIRFLIEVKASSLIESGHLDSVLRERLEKARILKPGGSFVRLGLVNCHYARNIDQLPEGEIETDVFGYYSNGNLAAGIAAWLARGGGHLARARP